MTVVVRAAVAGDADSGARCHLACWQEAYADLLEPDRLAAMMARLDEQLTLWRELIATRPILVAVDGDEVVGFAGAGPNHEDGVEVDFQLFVINVRQRLWGSGLGQQLLDRAIGRRDCFLWVAEDNPRAIAFYRRNGFRPDGAEQRDEMLDLPAIRMVRASPGSARSE